MHKKKICISLILRMFHLLSKGDNGSRKFVKRNYSQSFVFQICDLIFDKLSVWLILNLTFVVKMGFKYGVIYIFEFNFRNLISYFSRAFRKLSLNDNRKLMTIAYPPTAIWGEINQSLNHDWIIFDMHAWHFHKFAWKSKVGLIRSLSHGIIDIMST